MYSSENTPFSVLLESNTYFAQAQAAANTGNYEQAKSLYTQALGQAQDSVQRGQIAFKLALIEDHFGDPIKAIGMYKAIVANPEYDSNPLVKAYAVQSMTELHYRNPISAITAEIFKDTPYMSFVVEGNTQLTYRHLEEYAATFYPLGLVELRIAYWYAANVTATSTPDGSATSTYPALVQKAITLANADIERTKMDPNAATLIPDILVAKEALYARMYRNHLATSQETEQASKDAIAIYASMGPKYQDGFARYYYAAFLSTQDSSRIADMTAVLAPLYTDPGYKGSYIFSFLASEKWNLLKNKRQIVTFANQIPEFKALLLSLGWTSADFK
jgi:tetratricopeptide (TPR) repeat protein